MYLMILRFIVIITIKSFNMFPSMFFVSSTTMLSVPGYGVLRFITALSIVVVVVA